MVEERVEPGSARAIPARAYRVSAGADGSVQLDLDDVMLDDVHVVDGELVAHFAVVSNRCVLVGTAADGSLFGRPMEPIEPTDGALRFDPKAGGVRTRFNRYANGAFNEDIAEATRFGMVNALHHMQIASRYVDQLLHELGGPCMPSVKVVVGAHSGSQVQGFAQGDGDFRKSRGRMRPFTGGHYRLSTITSGTPEPIPVLPTGEIHFGPGRFRHPFAGNPSYLRNAAHNPATIYHEYAHHVCRHTADLRINAERAPDAQRNGKPGPEEGFCDYFAAALLGTGRPYGWFREARGHRRDPDVALRRAQEAGADPYAVGAVWASALWRCRSELLETGLLASPRDHDRAIVGALLHLGRVGARPDRRRRREREAVRSSAAVIASTYLESVRELVGGRAASSAARIFETAQLVAVEELGC